MELIHNHGNFFQYCVIIVTVSSPLYVLHYLFELKVFYSLIFFPPSYYLKFYETRSAYHVFLFYETVKINVVWAITMYFLR